MKFPLRRREGFPGQHHCVIPPMVAERARRHPLLRGLLVTDAGLYPHATGHYVERRGGAPGTVVIVCRAGAGWVRSAGRTIAIASGDVAVLRANVPHAYGAAEREPWTIEWAHYAGTEMAAWNHLLLGEAPVAVRLPPAEVAEVNLARVYEHLERGYGELELLGAAGALRASLTELARRREVPGVMAASRDAVDATADWMRAHLVERITLAALARRACLSPSHFSAVFRTRFGYAPIDWLIRQRVHRACSLLQSRPDKMVTIAREVGIADEYYFSRVFRRVMGVPPRAFRAQRVAHRPSLRTAARSEGLRATAG